MECVGEKLRSVLSGLDGSNEISELCRREGINPTEYYAWTKTLATNAGRIFNGEKDRPNTKQQRMEQELVRSKAVIAEITDEDLELKIDCGLNDYG